MRNTTIFGHAFDKDSFQLRHLLLTLHLSFLSTRICGATVVLQRHPGCHEQFCSRKVMVKSKACSALADLKMYVQTTKFERAGQELSDGPRVVQIRYSHLQKYEDMMLEPVYCYFSWDSLNSQLEQARAQLEISASVEVGELGVIHSSKDPKKGARCFSLCPPSLLR